MGFDEALVRRSEKFTEVLENKIEAQEGMFLEPHPFLRTAVRGLASRLNNEVAPMSFVLATELYVYDVNKGVNGFTGEAMPHDVTGTPPVVSALIRLAAMDVAREAFGDEFSDAVKQQYDQMQSEVSTDE